MLDGECVSDERRLNKDSVCMPDGKHPLFIMLFRAQFHAWKTLSKCDPEYLMAFAINLNNA